MPVVATTSAQAGQPPQPAPRRIQGIGAGFLPANLDLSLVDRVERLNSSEAVDDTRRLSREEGILAGLSCGAAVAAAARLARDEQLAGRNSAVILPDSAERHLSSVLFTRLFPLARLFPFTRLFPFEGLFDDQALAV